MWYTRTNNVVGRGVEFSMGKKVVFLLDFISISKYNYVNK